MNQETPDVYYLQSKEGDALTEPEMVRLMYELGCKKPEASTVYTWDDIGMATLISQLYEDSIRFCPQFGTWYIWDGTRWAAQIDSGVISDKIQTVLNMLLLYKQELAAAPHADLELLKNYDKYIRSVRKAGAIKAIMTIMESMCRIAATEFDSDPYILNTPVCAYDMRTMQPIADRGHHNLTQVTGCNLYTPNDPCARWYRFIDEIMSGDKVKAAFLQRALGYSMLGTGREECMFIAYGNQTRNGKGTLFSSIMAALGKEYAQNSDPALICENKHGIGVDFNAAQPGLRKLTNCRMVVMSEAPKDVKLNAASMKAMTGRDTLTTRGLYEKSFDFVPQFTLWLNTNYLPQISDDTVFKSNRIWVIKFNQHFDTETRDMDLKELFQAPENQPTILRWLVDGLQDYMLHGLNPPECVLDDTMEYCIKYDKIGSFLNDCTIRHPDEKTVRGDLYAAYRTWCCKADNRYQPMGSTSFYNALEDRGMWVKKEKDAYYVIGVKIAESKPGIVRLL